jgi:phenylalanyl-tRNA synthetase beta chain
MEEKEFFINLDYINRRIGIQIDIEEAKNFCEKMQLSAKVSDLKTLSILVPPFRSDILHACDIMEDVAIAYGYNNIKRTTPQVITVGKQQPLNKLTSMLSSIVANAGYYEILTLALNSKDDNYKLMRKKEDGQAVTLSNPKSSEYQIVRTSLIPGLLRTLSNNLKSSLPIKLFEMNDIVLVDDQSDVGASNLRYLSALYCNTKAELEIIHGLLDRLMESLNIKNYSIEPASDERFFQGRQANILFEGEVVGIFGILHPEVLHNFNIRYPCSVMELNVEKLKY